MTGAPIDNIWPDSDRTDRLVLGGMPTLICGVVLELKIDDARRPLAPGVAESVT